jgi:hypothetical protein
VRIEFQSQPGSPDLYFSNILLEENNVGSYFDGSSTRGGWVVDPNNIKVSDFQWYEPSGASASVNASFSIYNDNFQKTKALINLLLPTLLPVTELITSGTIYSNQPISVNKWSVVYNYLPGY